jgi:hypothetical protein
MRAFSSAVVGLRVISSSLWLCDCLGRCSCTERQTGNSMGLILGARDVHSFSDLRASLCFEAERWYPLLGRTSQILFTVALGALVVIRSGDEANEIESSTETA